MHNRNCPVLLSRGNRQTCSRVVCWTIWYSRSDTLSLSASANAHLGQGCLLCRCMGRRAASSSSLRLCQTCISYRPFRLRARRARCRCVYQAGLKRRATAQVRCSDRHVVVLRYCHRCTKHPACSHIDAHLLLTPLLLLARHALGVLLRHARGTGCRAAAKCIGDAASDT